MASEAAIDVRRLGPHEIERSLEAVARLRIEVFADFPYLYEGDLAYEARYLEAYTGSPGALIVVAEEPDGSIVGAATAAPLADHEPQFASAF